VQTLNEQFAKVGDVELCYETFGDPSDPAMLLIMGLATQMIGWDEDFCRALTERGYFVIRYDNRDVGRSTRFDHVKPPQPIELVRRKPKALAYTLEDMADDAARLLDHLGIERAHVVGASMGGMIAQLVAARHPDRVLSLASIMSSTGRRWAGQPALQVYPFFLSKPPVSRVEYVDRIVRLFRVIGSPGFETDESVLREHAELGYERGTSPAGAARQLAAIIASGNREQYLREIQAPTVVIHGKADRMVRPSGGKATARAIDGARLIMIDGMGHDLPRQLWPRLMDLIGENAERASRRAQRTAA
jgi:pimeloyl-ACP methyl ester carboxylesterase